jgi:ferric-dicitrate binding protein FerR (iron transport regulator)
MSDDRRHNDQGPPDRDAGRAIAVLARLPRSTAPDSAKESARMAFLHGSVVERLDRDDSAMDRTSDKSTDKPGRNPRRWINLLLAAALGMVAVFWFGSQPVEQWVVMGITSPEGITIAGEGQLAIGTTLESGLVTTGAESELVFQLGDKLRLNMQPETSLTLPKPPGRWFGRNRRLPLTSGEVYGTSGGQKLGFDLVFSTPELEARLTGTTFAVFRVDVASCVCLWHGGIAVTPLIGNYDMIQLPEKNRVWIYKDGREPELKSLDDREIMKLQMTHDGGVPVQPED